MFGVFELFGLLPFRSLSFQSFNLYLKLQLDEMKSSVSRLVEKMKLSYRFLFDLFFVKNMVRSWGWRCIFIAWIRKISQGVERVIKQWAYHMLHI